MRKIGRRHTDSIAESITELADLGLVAKASTQVRLYGGMATFKLYIINRSEAFFGVYPLTEHTVALEGKPVVMYDMAGKDVTLFHSDKADDPSRIGPCTLSRHRPGSTAFGTLSAGISPYD